MVKILKVIKHWLTITAVEPSFIHLGSGRSRGGGAKRAVPPRKIRVSPPVLALPTIGYMNVFSDNYTGKTNKKLIRR